MLYFLEIRCCAKSPVAPAADMSMYRSSCDIVMHIIFVLLLGQVPVRQYFLSLTELKTQKKYFSSSVLTLFYVTYIKPKEYNIIAQVAARKTTLSFLGRIKSRTFTIFEVPFRNISYLSVFYRYLRLTVFHLVVHSPKHHTRASYDFNLSLMHVVANTLKA